MTRRTIKNFAIASVLAASSLFASETRVATVTVPFAFRAGSVDLPAGVYQISKSESSILFLRTAGRTIALLSVGAAVSEPSKGNTVRFERIEGQTVLKEVLVDGGQGFLLRR